MAAFALPRKNLILLDHGEIGDRPLRIDMVLKHELCHLVLHHQIGEALPKWLDEGVCQWAGGGVAGIITGSTESVLPRAALLNRLIPFQELEARFPDDTDRLILAYEQSRSLVDFIALTYGRERLLLLLRDLGAGTAWQGAFSRSLGAPSDEIESKWREYVLGRSRWVYIAARHSHEMIFLGAALLTIFASIRILLSRKKQKALGRADDPPDQMPPS